MPAVTHVPHRTRFQGFESLDAGLHSFRNLTNASKGTWLNDSLKKLVELAENPLIGEIFGAPDKEEIKSVLSNRRSTGDLFIHKNRDNFITFYFYRSATIEVTTLNNQTATVPIVWECQYFPLGNIEEEFGEPKCDVTVIQKWIKSMAHGITACRRELRTANPDVVFLAEFANPYISTEEEHKERITKQGGQDINRFQMQHHYQGWKRTDFCYIQPYFYRTISIDKLRREIGMSLIFSIAKETEPDKALVIDNSVPLSFVAQAIKAISKLGYADDRGYKEVLESEVKIYRRRGESLKLHRMNERAPLEFNIKQLREKEFPRDEETEGCPQTKDTLQGIKDALSA